MNPGGKAEGRRVDIVRDALVGAQGVKGKHDAASYVVQDRQPERVQGPEAQDRGCGAAGCGLVYTPQGGEGFVGRLVKRKLGEKRDTYQFRRRSAGELLGVRDWAALQGDAVVPKAGEEILQLVGVHDLAGSSGGVSAGVGHGHHFGECGGQKAPVVAVDERGRWKGDAVSWEVEGERYGTIDGEGEGEDVAGGLVVKGGEGVTLIAVLSGGEGGGGGETLPGDHPDD